MAEYSSVFAKAIVLVLSRADGRDKMFRVVEKTCETAAAWLLQRRGGPPLRLVDTCAAVADGIAGGRRYMRFGRYAYNVPGIIDTFQSFERNNPLRYIEVINSVLGPLNDVMDDLLLLTDLKLLPQQWREPIEWANARLWAITCALDLTLIAWDIVQLRRRVALLRSEQHALEARVSWASVARVVGGGAGAGVAALPRLLPSASVGSELGVSTPVPFDPAAAAAAGILRSATPPAPSPSAAAAVVPGGCDAHLHGVSSPTAAAALRHANPCNAAAGAAALPGVCGGGSDGSSGHGVPAVASVVAFPGHHMAQVPSLTELNAAAESHAAAVNDAAASAATASAAAAAAAAADAERLKDIAAALRLEARAASALWLEWWKYSFDAANCALDLAAPDDDDDASSLRSAVKSAADGDGTRPDPAVLLLAPSVSRARAAARAPGLRGVAARYPWLAPLMGLCSALCASRRVWTLARRQVRRTAAAAAMAADK